MGAQPFLWLSCNSKLMTHDPCKFTFARYNYAMSSIWVIDTVQPPVTLLWFCQLRNMDNRLSARSPLSTFPSLGHVKVMLIVWLSWIPLYVLHLVGSHAFLARLSREPSLRPLGITPTLSTNLSPRIRVKVSSLLDMAEKHRLSFAKRHPRMFRVIPSPHLE